MLREKIMEDLNKITEKVIGCAIEVHKHLGPGLLESVYEKALVIELNNTELKHESQKSLPVKYKGKSVGEFKMDILVENEVVLELKSVERHDPVFEAQLLSYLKLCLMKVMQLGLAQLYLQSLALAQC